jgi:Flp pilus assembly protein TadG
VETIDSRSGVGNVGERGAAAVEFALVAPLLVLLICGIIDFGRAYSTLNQLAAAAREGARIAAVLPDPEGTQRTIVRDAVVMFAKGQLAGPDIARGSVDVDLKGDSTVTVTVQNYPFRLITPLASVIKSEATILMTRRATFRWERAALPPAP